MSELSLNALTAFNDLLTGQVQALVVLALAGNDVITGSAAVDVLNGYGGNDALNGGGGDDSLHGMAGIDSLVGGAGDDELVGDAVSERAGEGTDTVQSSISYTLAGGAGDDALHGGEGADNFVFNTAAGAANADTLEHFESGIDKIVLENAIFTGLGSALNPAAFVSNETGTALDASDRLVYNTTTGDLYYDSNGSIAGGAALVATLLDGFGGPPTLLASDFEVI